MARATCEKLISRHPHLFADQTAQSSEEVMGRWEEIKRVEKGQATISQAMEEVARSLPATWRSEKVQAKAAKVGFDFPNPSGALEKLQEEVLEVEKALPQGGKELEEEIGDVLFAAINLARMAGVDPEVALNQSTDKFMKRFSYLEEKITKAGKTFETLSLDEMEAIYQEGKNRL